MSVKVEMKINVTLRAGDKEVTIEMTREQALELYMQLSKSLGTPQLPRYEPHPLRRYEVVPPPYRPPVYPGSIPMVTCNNVTDAPQ